MKSSKGTSRKKLAKKRANRKSKNPSYYDEGFQSKYAKKKEAQHKALK